MNDNTLNIVCTEHDVMKLIDVLRRARESGRMLSVQSDRDYAGTLHVNLCALIRQADKLRAELEEYYGFVSEVRR